MSTLSYGIIGTGMMGQEHMRNIALLPDAKVTAIADPDEGMRKSGAVLAGDGVKVFADYREMIAADACDAYVVAAPNDVHYAVMKDLIQVGKPVLCEKPLCVTVAECREITAAADAAGAPVWVAMEYRYMAPIARLLEELRKGTAGRLHMIAIREHRYAFLSKVGDWNRFKHKTGGTLVEKCCHFFDLMRLAAGSEAKRVYASGAMSVNFLDEAYADGRPDMIDNAFVIVDFENGIRAMLDLCMFAEGSFWQETVTATGDRAKVEAFVPGPARFSADGCERSAELAIASRATKRETREDIVEDHAILTAGDHHGSTYHQHRRFMAFVRNGGAPQVSLEDGTKAVEIGIAAEESAVTGQAIVL